MNDAPTPNAPLTAAPDAGSTKPSNDATEPATDASYVSDASPLVRRVVLGGVGVLTVAGLIATASFPYLAVNHPLGLVALSPRIRNIVLVAPQCHPASLLALSIVRRVMALALTYGLGAIYGPAMLEKTVAKFPRLRRLLRGLERLVGRFGAPALFVLPTYTMAALAGIARTHLLASLAALTLGQTLWVTTAIFFGDVVAPLTQWVMAQFQRYMVPATATCACLVVAQQAWVRYRARRESP